MHGRDVKVQCRGPDPQMADQLRSDRLQMRRTGRSGFRFQRPLTLRLLCANSALARSCVLLRIHLTQDQLLEQRRRSRVLVLAHRQATAPQIFRDVQVAIQQSLLERRARVVKRDLVRAQLQQQLVQRFQLATTRMLDQRCASRKDALKIRWSFQSDGFQPLQLRDGHLMSNERSIGGVRVEIHIRQQVVPVKRCRLELRRLHP